MGDPQALVTARDDPNFGNQLRDTESEFGMTVAHPVAGARNRLGGISRSAGALFPGNAETVGGGLRN